MTRKVDFLERISLNQFGNDFDARKVKHAVTTPQATVGGSLPETGDPSIMCINQK